MLLFFISSLNLTGQQLIYKVAYSYTPNITIDASFVCVPNELYQFDFWAASVPDWLIIYTNSAQTDSIVFYVGSKPNDTTSYFYEGYSEVTYDDGVLNLIIENAELPENTNFTLKTGAMTLFFRVPDKLCTLAFKTRTNRTVSSLYELSVYKLEEGFIEISDTIYKNICEKKSSHILYEDCDKKYIIYNDSSIQTKINVTPTTCYEKSNGSIEFQDYPQFNQYNLETGLHNIKVYNSYCEEFFTIEVPTKKICNYFIPNIFTPDGDGNNDEFMLYLPTNIEYDLRIYDRWGGLVYGRKHITSFSGWDGQNAQEGVYTYIIRCMGDELTGTITILK